MTKFKLLFFIFLFSPLAHAQWLDVPLPGVGNNFRIEQFVWVNETTIVCHDASGNFCISEDGGNSYTPQATGFGGLGFLSHPSKEIGYVIDLGTNKMYKTTDTWKTFYPLLISNGTDTGFKSNPIVFCHFWDTLQGVAMGDSVNGCLEIWTTQNGGILWNQVPCNSEINLKFKNNLSSAAHPCFEALGDGGFIGFPRENRMFFKISDFGQTWIQNKVPASLNFFGYFSFKNNSEGVIIRDIFDDNTRTNIAVTQDGGMTWDTSFMFPEVAGRVEFASATSNYPEIYMLVGVGSYIIRSFSEPYIKVDDQLHDEVSFYDAENGVSYFQVKNGFGARVFDPQVIRTSVVQAKTTEFDFYPNPASTQLNVNSSSQGTLQIIDIMGVERESFQVEAGMTNLRLSLTPGNYFVVINGAFSRTLTIIE